jgi:hypothetical protein
VDPSADELLEQRQPQDKGHASNDKANHDPRPTVIQLPTCDVFGRFLGDCHTRATLAARAQFPESSLTLVAGCGNHFRAASHRNSPRSGPDQGTEHQESIDEYEYTDAEGHHSSTGNDDDTNACHRQRYEHLNDYVWIGGA